jgi:gliding motility-associated-like protein
MKRHLILMFFLCFAVSFSQQQASNWYFGENSGIQFDNNNNVTDLTDGRLNTVEGCSSISDDNGDLLFYTDGSIVYNKEHNIMLNGTGLLGDASSTQSAIVIPKPEDPNIYYIFTVGSNATNTGLKYSVVDITGDSGRGEVTLKNQNLLSQCAEKIAAVLKDCESGAIWVVTMSNINGTSTFDMNSFHAFEVSTTGINTTAVVSSFSRLRFTDMRGYLKLSPDGTKLGCAVLDGGFYLFDFDTQTGIASNELRLTVPTTNNQPYGAEFSPNSQVLYITASNDLFGAGDSDPRNHHSILVQYDLTAADISSTVTVLDNRDLYRSALQLGPDGKIYRTMSATYFNGLPFLSRINNPNTIGIGCDYEHNAISLGNNSTQGLPPFIASFFTEKIDIIRNGQETTFLPLCIGDSYTLTADDIPGAIYTWTMDGNLLSESDYDLEITQPGTYNITIDLNNGDCEFIEGEAIVEYFNIPIASAVTDFKICDDDNNDLWEFDLTTKDLEIIGPQDPSVFSVHYFESQMDAFNNENEITGLLPNTMNPTPIYARIHNDGNPNCYDTTSFLLEVFNSPTVIPLDTQKFCDNNDDGDSANGQIEIDLQGYDMLILNGQPLSDYSITYHSSQLDAENGSGDLPNIYYNQIPFQEEIFARIENNLNSNCFDTTSFIVIIDPIPESFDSELIQCDEDGTVDGITTFNLNEAFNELTGNSNTVFIEFYDSITNAESSSGILNAVSYNNRTNPEIVYAKVIDNDTQCFSISELRLEVSTTQISNFTVPPVCDELDSEDGINTFDLDIITIAIQNDNGLVFPVTYYETYRDALLEQNELSSPYNNTTPYNQTLFSRVENNNACYGIGEVILTINPLPELEEDETFLYCLNFFPETLLIDAGILNDDPNNYTYNWSSGQDTYEIAINEIGIYTVTATNSFGCSKSRNIIIEPSNIATIESFEVIDASNNNSITVIVSGEGEYDYSLLDQNGVFMSWQAENIFTNIPPGIYTVLVRDLKNDCGIVEDMVSVIGFPKFFTPNGDGSNDTWNIRGVSGQFQPNTRVLIFDRYGKLLKELSPLGQGWDGTYNGQVLPVSDYWFSVKLQDGRLFKSHFTLKY